MNEAARDLYEPIEPYRSGFLNVDGGHTIYFEESGNPDGKPVVFLHGGPGGGSDPKHRRYFNPKKYRIVIFDQRGCGRSTPFASLESNTTWHLVSDIEALRQHLGIEQWVVFGGSWGSTLALVYAQTHPERVQGLILRGIFLLRKWEIDWFYQDGASHLFPDYWEEFVAPIPEAERGDMVSAYYKRLTSSNMAERLEAAKAWSTWEGRTVHFIPDETEIAKFATGQFAEPFARIECHYFMHGGWLSGDKAILKNIDKIRHIPAVIVQGRYDVVCPVESAWALHRAWPEAKFVIVPTAGHAASEPGIVHELITATDALV